MNVFDYITAPNETVHLTRQIPWESLPSTLCGRTSTNDWLFGDETVSGICATCKTCRRIMTRERENA